MSWRFKTADLCCLLVASQKSTKISGPKKIKIGKFLNNVNKISTLLVKMINPVGYIYVWLKHDQPCRLIDQRFLRLLLLDPTPGVIRLVLSNEARRGTKMETPTVWSFSNSQRTMGYHGCCFFVHIYLGLAGQHLSTTRLNAPHSSISPSNLLCMSSSLRSHVGSQQEQEEKSNKKNFEDVMSLEKTKHTKKKQDEAHEPECRHVCSGTETILIYQIFQRTHLWDILRRHTEATVLWDTLAFAWHYYAKLW